MAEYVYDGNMSFSTGQNNGVLPHLLGQTDFFSGENISTKTGGISPRAGFIEQELEFVDDSIKINSLSIKEIFKYGKFQALAPYDTNEGRFLICVISGTIFRINPKTNTVEYIPIEDEDRVNEYARRVNWTQAGRFFVLFDYPNNPIIIERNKARRANLLATNISGSPVPEVPPSILGAFVQNRLFIANEGGEFTAGDPIGGLNLDAPITFEEVLVPGSAYYNQIFSISSQYTNSKITAMGFFQSADTSTGYGPLFVSTNNSFYIYAANTPRSNWENTTFGNLALYDCGIVGPRAFVNVNSDLIFIDLFGNIRSFATNQYNQKKWGNSPISREIEGWQKNIDLSLLEYSFVSYYNNRIFISSYPYLTIAKDTYGKETLDIAHDRLIVLELNNTGSIKEETVPAWAGIWTGLHPLEMVVGDRELFCLSKDGRRNIFYKISDDFNYDLIRKEKRQIKSTIITREYEFDSPFIDKLLISVDYRISDIVGNPFKMKVEYKAGHSGKWSLWRDWTHYAKIDTCDAGCDKLEEYLPHNFRNINLGDPEEQECDPLTDDLNLTFRGLNLKISFTSNNFILESIRIKAQGQPETENYDIKCNDITSIKIIKDCPSGD